MGERRRGAGDAGRQALEMTVLQRTSSSPASSDCSWAWSVRGHVPGRDGYGHVSSVVARGSASHLGGCRVESRLHRPIARYSAGMARDSPIAGARGVRVRVSPPSRRLLHAVAPGR
jgi:hypothetical protein